VARRYGPTYPRRYRPDPPLKLPGLLERLSAADRALGRLDGISLLLPNKELFLYMYVRKEAVLSSQIEGTQSTLNDLLRYETDATAGVSVDDIREVSNYVSATMHGLERMKTLPLSLRLIREMHAMLLDSGRGSGMAPGEFRTTQNWIGGTRPGNAVYVPPPPHLLMPALDQFEKFIHADTPPIPPLIKAGLLHVQFESIHPFLDGNGRLGRLLVTLFLCAQGVMREPLLYLSLYFKIHRTDYYRLLQEVRERGAWEAWEAWLEFFLEGVAETANQAFDSATRIAALFARDREKIAEGGERTGSALQVHEALILLRHKLRRCGYLWIGVLQHGHRGRALTRAAINRRRIVAIEFGTCRSGRSGGALGPGTGGNGRRREQLGGTRS
jgi:Fic family protein